MHNCQSQNSSPAFASWPCALGTLPASTRPLRLTHEAELLLLPPRPVGHCRLRDANTGAILARSWAHGWLVNASVCRWPGQITWKPDFQN